MRKTLFPAFILSFSAATYSLNSHADEQRLNCAGNAHGEDMLTAEHTETTPAEFLLRVLRQDNKVYLALASEAHIEAREVDGSYRLDDVPDTLGTRSLSYNPHSRTLSYRAVVTRHGEAVSAYHFNGSCQPIIDAP
jgi:hypothetical protein